MTPATISRIVCLANSRRAGGRCVAGKELQPDGRPGPWVRPVSSRSSEEVSDLERQYADGSEPRLLDVIEIPFFDPVPSGFQSENRRLDPARRWVKSGRIGWDDLPAWQDADAPLWTNGHHSGAGENDRVPVADANRHSDSLRLIRVDQLLVSVSEPARLSSLYPILRGHFHYNGADYRLRITDADRENGAIDLPYGEYPVGERYLTISLGGAFEGYAYKLIAAIIKP